MKKIKVGERIEDLLEYSCTTFQNPLELLLIPDRIVVMGAIHQLAQNDTAL